MNSADRIRSYFGVRKTTTRRRFVITRYAKRDTLRNGTRSVVPAVQRHVTPGRLTARRRGDGGQKSVYRFSRTVSEMIGLARKRPVPFSSRISDCGIHESSGPVRIYKSYRIYRFGTYLYIYVHNEPFTRFKTRCTDSVFIFTFSLTNQLKSSTGNAGGDRKVGPKLV